MVPAIYPYLRLLAYWVFSPYTSLVIGIAMISGSLRGMQQAWSELIW
jgi:hypothetical protein